MSRAFAVLLAGGHGTRLWPLSRRARPKQFLDVVGEGAMIAAAFRHAVAIVGHERVLVVAGADQAAHVRAALPALARDALLVEPAKRGTGPALALAAAEARARGGDAILVLPADHLIVDASAYHDALRAALDAAAATRRIVGVGLPPRAASTAYGYLETADAIPGSRARVVRRFTEKPDADTARRWFADGHHLWNTGTYAIPLDAFERDLAAHAPSIADAVAGLRRGDAAAYARAPDVAIERAVLERSDALAAIEGTHRRIDLGNLDSLAEALPAGPDGNVGRGPRASVGAKDNVVWAEGALVGLVGVEGIVVVSLPDVVLVMRRGEGQRVAELLAALPSSSEALR